ncbi:restriction endonuclease subunit S [Streptococcus anginosus]|uniref:restriction endonuclease subunit S n=1 Tax=Streptococcus anginosus TaxID=1328 RepID=UPI0034A1D461
MSCFFLFAWEQRKLGEVSTHRCGTSIEKYFDSKGVYKVISIGSYGLDGEYIDQGIRASSNNITDKKTVKNNELTMVLNDKTTNGIIIGRTLLIRSDNEYVVNQRTEIISPNNNFDSQFAFTLLNSSFREQVKKIVQGGTQIYVNYSSVERLKFYIPSLSEQKAIGDFFSTLDRSIALHQRE